MATLSTQEASVYLSSKGVYLSAAKLSQLAKVGVFPNAQKDAQNRWQILEADLEQYMLASRKTLKRSWIATRIDNTRTCLTHNKIFFETVAALFLSGMAVVLSYWQWQVSKEQTEYLKQQITIEREQAMPQFVIRQTGIDNKATTISEEKLSIINQGNIAREIDILYMVFFDLNSYDGTKEKKLSIPIMGYYKKRLLTQNSTGIVATTNNDAVFKNIAKVEDEISQLNQGTDTRIHFYISRYVEIYYKDIFNNPHLDYFYINPVNGPELIDYDEWKRLQIKYTELKLAPDFSTITTEDLLSIFEKNSK